MRGAMAALAGILGPRKIDQNLPHETSRNREKVRAAGPVDGFTGDQPQERLIHQGGRLQQMPVALTGQIATGQAVQFRVNHGSQPIQRGLVATTPGLEDASQLDSGEHICPILLPSIPY